MDGVEEDVDWSLIPDSIFSAIGDQMDKELAERGLQTDAEVKHLENSCKIKDVKPLLGSGPVGMLRSVRVTSKSHIINWSNKNGNGTLFNAVLLDETGEIQVTGFNDAVTRCYHLLTVGEVYDLENLCIQKARKEFNRLSHPYEIVLCNESIIRAVVGNEVLELPPPPILSLNVLSFCDLESKADGSIVDVLGICTSFKALQTVLARTSNKEHYKRDIYLVDDTCREVVCTIWDTAARNFAPNTFPLVVCIKDAKVISFQKQKCLGTAPSSQMILDPDGCEDAAKLRRWFLAGGFRKIPIRYLSRPVDHSVPSHFVYEIDSDRQRYAEGFNFKCVVTVLDVRWDNALFLSCRRCHRKVLPIEDGVVADGGSKSHEESTMKCVYCNLVVSSSDVSSRFMLLVRFADASSSIWVKVFHEDSESLLGQTAASLLLAYTKDKDKFRGIVEAVRFERFIVGIFAKQNDIRANSLTYSCTFISKIDYGVLANEWLMDVQLRGKSS